MEITIELVVLYLYNNKEHYNFVFNKLKAIIDDSSYKLPIYGINYQIKEPDSIFLKTKRKKDISTFTQITDYAGIRIICLFEKDIVEVDKYLTTILLQHYFSYEELKIFNWDQSEYK